MIDISQKKAIVREATAEGKLYLKSSTIEVIKKKEAKKGDALEISRIAGINAVKQTQFLIPMCHQIPIETITFNFELEKDHIVTQCYVKTTAKTGVEMEALVGVSTALNNLWDMVKYLEKDKDGQYPISKITDIVVLKKVKHND